MYGVRLLFHGGHTFDQATITSKGLLKRENIWLGKFSCELYSIIFNYNLSATQYSLQITKEI